MRTTLVLVTAFSICAAFAAPQVKPAPKPIAPPIYPMVPQLTSSSAIIMDAATGQILFEKDAYSARFPASTTKIMTALLLCEKLKPLDVISAPVDIEKVGESSLHLRPSEQISAEDALYALMVRSANDVAHAVAVKIAGSDVEFAKLMNARASELGCKSTTFFNPHGLNHPYHKTSAYDLALMAREALRNPQFAVACSTKTKWIRRSLNQGDLFLKTKNRFLDVPGSIGVKTGYTKPAGHCYVGAMDFGGWRVITVVMNSQDWLSETKLLCDWTKLNFENRVIAKRGTIVGTASILDGEKSEVAGETNADLNVIEPITSVPSSPSIEMTSNIMAPIVKGQRIGSVTYYGVSGKSSVVPVVATETIKAKPQTSFAMLGVGGIGGLAALVLLGSFASRSGNGRRKKLRRA